MKTSVLVALSILGLTAIASPVAAQNQETHTINGVLTVYGKGSIYDYTIDRVGDSNNPYTDGEQCVASGYVSDLNYLSISVRDGENHLIGIGKMLSGTFRKINGLMTCQIPFTIPNIPKSAFYSIKMGNRGVLDYSFDELVKDGWDIEMHIGL